MPDPNLVESSAKVAELSSRVQAIASRGIDQNARTIEESDDARALSPDGLRLLDYFYNKHRHETRDKIPLSVVTFFECADYHESVSQVIACNIDVTVQRLEYAKFLKQEKRSDGIEYLELTAKGVRFMERRHPKALVWWAKALEAIPPTTSLLVSALGAVASIFGIVEFAIHYL